jgi:hypothetical protein
MATLEMIQNAVGRLVGLAGSGTDAVSIEKLRRELILAWTSAEFTKFREAYGKLAPEADRREYCGEHTPFQAAYIEVQGAFRAFITCDVKNEEFLPRAYGLKIYLDNLRHCSDAINDAFKKPRDQR